MKRYVGWVLLYLVVMGAITFALFQAREATIASLDTPQARADWQQWKHDAQEKAERQERAAVKSNDPPGLILMRDHFAGILGGTLVIATFLYIFLVLTLRGSFHRGGPPYDLER
jgi:hypothetical protein